MHVGHLLRKYNPSEWGGTETAVHRLLEGLRAHDVASTVFCPSLESAPSIDPLREDGFAVENFSAFAPVWNISEEQKKLLISVGGNLMSFDLLGKLLRQENLSVIHAHSGNRLGGIALTAAKLKKIPFVFSIHGGVLDLPESTKTFLQQPLKGGIEWGKFFGLLFGSRKVLAEADAILTCNKCEAALQQKQFPGKRIIVQPHAVSLERFQADHREDALRAFPRLHGKDVLLSIGRIDPVKNQHWLVEQMPGVLQKFPSTLLVLAGACTDKGYGKMLEGKIEQLGLGNSVLLTGSFPPQDHRLIGLLQHSKVVLLPSLSETFGLVILEAWAAKKPVLSSRTSGATDLISEMENGLLFDADKPDTFHRALKTVLTHEELASRLAANGASTVAKDFDTKVMGGRMKQLYEQLIEEKK